MDKKEPEKLRDIKPPGKMGEVSGQGIGSRVHELESQLKVLVGDKEEKMKKKSFKFPSRVKATTRNIKRMIEKNKVQVIYLKESAGIDPIIGEYTNGKVVLPNGNFHDATGDVFWNWGKGIPTMLIPEWDMLPISRSRLKLETEQFKSSIHPQKIILRSIEAREALDKLKGRGLSPKAMLIIGIVAIIVMYVLFAGQ